MKKNELKIGALLSYIQILLGVVIGAAYTPIMTRLLGQDEYGLYNTVSSTISMLSILDLGFNSSYIRYHAQYRNEDDRDRIYRLNGMFFVLFMGIGIIASICGLYLSFHLDILFSSGLTQKEYETARILMILLTINLAVSFPMSVFSDIIFAKERFIFLKVLGILKTAAGPFVTIPLLLMGYRSVAMVSVTLSISMITDIIYLSYVLFYLKERFVFHGFDKRLFGSLFAYSIFIAVNFIVDQVNWNIDKILLGRFKGTASVAVYSVGYSLYQYYQMFSTAISNVFTPKIHKIVRATLDDPKEQGRQLTGLFIRVGRSQAIVLGLIASGLVFYGRYFITRIWVGEGYAGAYYVMLLLTLPASIALIQNLGIEIQRAENKHQFRSIVYLLMASVNLVLSIYLCQIWGAIGCALGTAFSLLLANGLIMNIFYHKKCGLDIFKFWKEIFHLMRGMIIPFSFGIISQKYLQIRDRMDFLISVMIYTGIYGISMWSIGMDAREKEVVRRLFDKRRILTERGGTDDKGRG